MRYLPKIAALGLVFALGSCLLPEYSVDESMGGTGGTTVDLPELPPKPDGCGPHADMVPIRGGYCIDRTEVTWAKYGEWAAAADLDLVLKGNQTEHCKSWNTVFSIVPDGDCSPPPNLDERPVVCIDWCDAFAYCKDIGKKLCGGVGGTPITLQDWDRAEKSQWMNACSSGQRYEFPYGDELDLGVCHANQPGGQPTAIQSKPECKSPEGDYANVFDLSGNVAEWEDACSGDGATGNCRLRGGSFKETEADKLSCSASTFTQRERTNSHVGFRCCWDPPK